MVHFLKGVIDMDLKLSLSEIGLICRSLRASSDDECIALSDQLIADVLAFVYSHKMPTFVFDSWLDEYGLRA